MLRVAVPAAARALTTEARAMEFLGIGDGDLPPFAIGEAIATASSAIARHCCDGFARQGYVETFYLEGTKVLVLSHGPALIDTVTVDGTVVVADAFDYDPVCWHLRRSDGQCWWGCRAEVTYTAGWSLPGASDRDLPQDIEMACLLYISAMYHGQGRDPLLRSETTEGVGSTSFVANSQMDALPPQALALLKPYRVARIA